MTVFASMPTPQTKHPYLAKNLGLLEPLYFKREDLHPLLSHKGRSLPIMMDLQIKKGKLNFVISSSGNAALAAASHTKKLNKKTRAKLTLRIFVGEKIYPAKLKKLKQLTDKNITLIKIKNPKQSAFLLQKSGEAVWLRQSTDDNALIGYESLAKELAKIKNLAAVFVPTSSGTTALGLNKGFKKLKLKIQIHVAQTLAVHPIALPFVKNEKIATTGEASIASAIVDKVALRKPELIKAIKASRGSGWIISDKEIVDAIKYTTKTEKIKLSPNSALAVAALKQALESGYKFKGAVVCLITGQ